MLRDLEVGAVLKVMTPIPLPDNDASIYFVAGRRQLPMAGSTFCAFEPSRAEDASRELKGRLQITKVFEDHDPETGAYNGTYLNVMQLSEDGKESLSPAAVVSIRCVRNLEVDKILNIWVAGEAMDSYPTNDGDPPTVKDFINALKGIVTLDL